MLPLVDISGLDSDRREDRAEVAAALDRACAEAGFLYITGKQFRAPLFRRLRERAELYFRQSSETKMASYIGLSENHSGYVPAGEEQFEGGGEDLKEAYDVNRDYRLLDGRRPLLGPTLWPAMAGFREDVLAYYEHLDAVGRQLFGAFAMALGLAEDHFSPYLKNPPNQLRLIHYPQCAEAEDRPGIGAHSDYECFTLLFATAPGLQVVDPQGQWVDVPLVEGAMIMNIGDMLEVLSNGRYIATRHRVRKVREERYAFPLFFACDYDYVVEPVVEREAPRYAPVRGGEHLYNQTLRTFAYLRRRAQADQLNPGSARGATVYGRREADSAR